MCEGQHRHGFMTVSAFVDGSIAIGVVRASVVAIPDTVMVTIDAAGPAIMISRVSIVIPVRAVINNAAG